MSSSKTSLLAIIIVAGVLRIFCARDVPLSGDEVGVGMLQASGQAVAYQTYQRTSPRGAVPIEEIKGFVSYSEEASIKDIWFSLRYAGQHPPFYYILLHYAVKYVDGVFALRLTSILLSLCSVLLIYRLGTTVYGEHVGSYSALFLAISAYGVMYAMMVRPYPLAMLLSLLSTVQAYGLSGGSASDFNRKKLLLYGFTVMMGLYTIYHFIFVFLSQIAFLMMCKWRDKKALWGIGAVTGLIFVSYLPWVPSLIDQTRSVVQHNYYFHGTSNLLSFVKYITYTSLAGDFGSGPLMVVTKLIRVMVYTLMLTGCYYVSRSMKGRAFLLALGIYVLSWYAGDRIINTNTLNVEKLLFFVVPISFVLLAVGMCSIPNRYQIRTALMVICCGTLMYKSVMMCYQPPPVFAGTERLISFRETISEFLRRDQKGLVIMNTAARRFLLSFAYAIEDPVDIKIARADNMGLDLSDISNLKDYDVVFVVNFYVPYETESFFSTEDLKSISGYLTKRGFRPIEPAELWLEAGRSSLLVFGK